MHSESPLLTIGIPTYNRSRYLARLLDSLTPQLENETRVELLISDNASPDGTQATLEGYREQGLVFRSIRNQTNIGADGNIGQCFAEAAGKYVWIIGDDDVVIQDGLVSILSLIAQEEFDIVHLRAMDFSEGQQPHILSRPPRIEIIHDPRTFALRTHVFLTFIAGNIINKQRVLSLPHRDFSELMGTSLGHLSWTYTALRSFRKGACILDPLIAAGADDRGGYALFTVFGTNLKRITETWLVEPDLVRIVMNGTLQTFFPTFVLRSKLRAGKFTEENPDVLLDSLFSNNYRYYFFIYPLLKLPSKLARVWLLLCRVVNRLDKVIGNPMLR
ncbi:MAG: putative glycosyltransferase [Edaphobacter sp.]|nr:putative glycosyltransferase [Edaphobacter sp.]